MIFRGYANQTVVTVMASISTKTFCLGNKMTIDEFDTFDESIQFLYGPEEEPFRDEEEDEDDLQITAPELCPSSDDDGWAAAIYGSGIPDIDGNVYLADGMYMNAEGEIFEM